MYDFLCVDLETAAARPEDVQREFLTEWKLSPTWKKPETMAKKFTEAFEKAQQKASLCINAPIISIGVRTDIDLRCIHSMYQHEQKFIEGAASIEGFESLKECLKAFRTLLDTFTDPDTILVGHNIKSFDLPRLRFAYVANNLKLPQALLNPDQPVFDSMIMYRKYTSRKDDFMVGLNEVLESFHLPSHKDVVDGAEIPILYERGDYDTIIEYQLLDVICEADLYLRMTGAHQALE